MDSVNEYFLDSFGNWNGWSWQFWTSIAHVEFFGQSLYDCISNVEFDYHSFSLI
jgi:hypothetical protein